jgi:hypothetical protein
VYRDQFGQDINVLATSYSSRGGRDRGIYAVNENGDMKLAATSALNPLVQSALLYFCSDLLLELRILVRILVE